MWVRDRLDGLWCNEDFVAAWYPRDGRPGLSPAQLTTVCVPQFLLNLSDRQAAEAVRCRIDFKHALGLELDDAGFHHSVLGDFRDRIAQDDRADRLLELALERLTVAGLVAARGRQRTDSTHVLAAARDLTRLELVIETVRAALEETAVRAPELPDGLVDAGWAERYGRPARLCSQPSHPVRHRLPGTVRTAPCAGPDPGRRTTPGDSAAGPGPAVRHRPPWPAASPHRQGRHAAGSPADPLPVRHRDPLGAAGHTRWSGYLLHVTKTCGSDSPNVITDVATTVPIRDTEAVPGIQARLAGRRLLSAEHLADGGYLSAALIDTARRDHGVVMASPVKASGQ